ncbi:MAG: carboxypeptidase-like regulatory domain-containing protein [Planctomycetota bacterium]
MQPLRAALVVLLCLLAIDLPRPATADPGPPDGADDSPQLVRFVFMLTGTQRRQANDDWSVTAREEADNGGFRTVWRSHRLRVDQHMMWAVPPAVEKAVSGKLHLVAQLHDGRSSCTIAETVITLADQRREEVATIRFEMPTFATVRGTVRDTAGNGLRRWIRLKVTDTTAGLRSSTERTALSEESGEYRIPNAPAGLGRLELDRPFDLLDGGQLAEGGRIEWGQSLTQDLQERKKAGPHVELPGYLDVRLGTKIDGCAVLALPGGGKLPVEVFPLRDGAAFRCVYHPEQKGHAVRVWVFASNGDFAVATATLEPKVVELSLAAAPRVQLRAAAGTRVQLRYPLSDVAVWRGAANAAGVVELPDYPHEMQYAGVTVGDDESPAPYLFALVRAAGALPADATDAAAQPMLDASQAFWLRGSDDALRDAVRNLPAALREPGDALPEAKRRFDSMQR